jgi:uncharacterized membrane protein YqaE (UPF0057 family)
MSNNNTSCCNVFLTLLCSPLGLFCKRGTCDGDVILNLILFIVGVDIVGIIHAFYLHGISLTISILCFFVPPLGVFVATQSCCKALICFLLFLCGIIPGVIYAYYQSINDNARDTYKVNLTPENRV